jgi:hypothetical protein
LQCSVERAASAGTALALHCSGTCISEDHMK